MTTAVEYHLYADECLRWAAQSKCENDRNAFLEMARAWTWAAMRTEGVLIPDSMNKSQQPTIGLPTNPDASPPSATVAEGVRPIRRMRNSRSIEDRVRRAQR